MVKKSKSEFVIVHCTKDNIDSRVAAEHDLSIHRAIEANKKKVGKKKLGKTFRRTLVKNRRPKSRKNK